MKIDITEIEDDLEGPNWNYFRVSSDFAYLNYIPDHHAVEVLDDDILMHKQMETNDQGFTYPAKRYHQILDGEAFQVDGKDVRELMAHNVIKYAKENKKLPFACHVKKLYKNNNMDIEYDPNNFDKFVLKISPELCNMEADEMVEFFNQLPKTTKNVLDENSVGVKIEPIAGNPVIEQVAMESGKDKVYVKEAEILAIDLRKSFFQGSETIYYLLQIQGGSAAPSDDKEVLWRDFEKMNVKCSDGAMDKYELKVGDKITFNGKLKKSKKQILLQNIRKFDKK